MIATGQTTGDIVAHDRDLQPPLYAKRDIALVRSMDRLR